MSRSVKTPAASHLFNVNKDAKKLQEDKAQLFHHLVANYYIYCAEQDKTFKWQ